VADTSKMSSSCMCTFSV